MDDRRVGRLIRKARIRKGWRQRDLEEVAGVDQTTISLIERGQYVRLTLRTIRDVALALGIPLELWPRLPAAEVSRLLDEGHAANVEHMMRILADRGWQTIAEYTFSHYGERGSVDILAWHPASRTLLITEVKTVVIDLQEVLSTLDRKVRIVPQLVSSERAWRPAAIGKLLVVEDSTVARRVVRSHAATFDAALPDRSRRARAWVAEPSGSFAGIWFVSLTNRGRANRRDGAVQRVRRPKSAAGRF